MKSYIWINFLVGVWLIIAPFALAAGGITTWGANDIVVGVLLMASAWWILAVPSAPSTVAWFEMLCGVWLIVAPFVLGYGGMMSVVWNDVLCGLIALIFAAGSQVGTRTPTAA